MIRTLIPAFVSLVMLTSCNRHNPYSCAPLENAAECLDGGGASCTKNEECKEKPGTPICDTGKPTGAVCVQCTADQASQCSGATPRCDTETNTCSACIADRDCGTKGVCLLNGACADADKIIHAIAMGGSSGETMCGGLGSACDLETALAVAKASAAKNIIKLDDPDPAVYKGTNGNLVIDVDPGSDLIIDARGALIERNMDGPILTLNNGKGATVLGGTIQGAHGGGGDAIRCNMGATLTLQGTTIKMSDASAINASGCTVTVTDGNIVDNNKAGTSVAGIQTTGGSLTISRSSIASNQGGGIQVNSPGTFTIVGNAFLANGDPSTVVGGFSVTTSAAGNRLEFNTFTANKSDNGVGTGIACTVTRFTGQNNIVWNNNQTTDIQISGSCKHAFSDIGPMSIIGMPSFDAGDNLSEDPLFMSSTTDVRLRAMTPVRGKANSAADLTGLAETDIAHMKRVSPADLGAYVAPPP